MKAILRNNLTVLGWVRVPQRSRVVGF